MHRGRTKLLYLQHRLPAWLTEDASPTLSDQLVVVGVCADPKPEHTALNILAKHSVLVSHSRRPQRTDFLEVEGRVVRIVLEERVILVGGSPDFCRQCRIERPKLSRRDMLQSGRVRPAL